MSCRPIDLPLEPGHVLERWPSDRPLAACWAAPNAPHRWTVLASPHPVLDPADAERHLSLPLAAGGAAQCPEASADLPPFRGGLIGWVAYDAARALEPRAFLPTRFPPADAPDMVWARCPDALAYDAHRRVWWAIGDGAALVADLESAPPRETFRVGPLRSRTGRAAYLAACARVIEYIRAGDIYQANLAHRLDAPFEGSSRALWRAMLHAAHPWHGVYVESPAHALTMCGVSPELFLEFDPASRRLTTRPMKGTRPATPGARADLEHSPKDRAELAMIVDLMRNDLGRVCELGSVRVDRPRDIDRHAALWQATATVSGTLEHGRSALDVLRAAFPCGSVTGAPKVRAMQIIDELEPEPRGPYCGLAGFVSDHGAFSWAVSIRTAIVRHAASGARLHYSVGAGIVADSDPPGEWRETLAKAAALRKALRTPAGSTRP
ncbi:MAG: anthranilate synthase component I family protein [Planctomycetota bacterium]|nr:anthranilate synthase component I family protein [Planctomycetota bacterium]